MTIAEDLEAEAKLARLGNLLNEFDKRGYDPKNIGRIDKVKFYQGMAKDADGDPQILDMSSIQFTPSWDDGPKWPALQQSGVYKLPTRGVKPSIENGFETCVVLPDMQIGYYYDEAGNLIPTHDEAALGVALAVTKAARPTRIILVGDNADLPDFSKYRLTPAYQQTTQPTLDRVGLLLAELRSVAPEAEIDYLEGNHEARLPNMILDNAAAAYGLKQANRPESWPVLSFRFLTRMDDYGVEYHPGYPASEVWINDRLKAIHGDITGPTCADKYLAREKVSVVFGHSHHRVWKEINRQGRHGVHTQLAMSSGCLCDITGKVPSTKQGINDNGRPVPKAEDWQQGLAVFTHQKGDGMFWPEQIPIHSGRTFWRGKHYVA